MSKICETCNVLEGGFLGLPICSVCVNLCGVIAQTKTLEEAEEVVKTIFKYVSPKAFLVQEKS